MLKMKDSYDQTGRRRPLLDFIKAWNVPTGETTLWRAKAEFLREIGG